MYLHLHIKFMINTFFDKKIILPISQAPIYNRCINHHIVPEGTHRVLFCSWSIFVEIWAHISIRFAPA